MATKIQKVKPGMKRKRNVLSVLDKLTIPDRVDIAQHQELTPHDIIFIRKWLNIAAAGRAQGKQGTLDSFFVKKKQM